MTDDEGRRSGERMSDLESLMWNLDGDPVPIVRADHAHRLIALPQRACRVTFRYRAPGLALGSALATLATVALALSAFATRRMANQRTI